jgi:hypothetical protein
MQRLQIEKIAREKQLEIWAAHWQQQGFSPEEIQVPPLPPSLPHLYMPNICLRPLVTLRCCRWRRPPLPPPTPPPRTCPPLPPKLLQQPPPPR